MSSAVITTSQQASPVKGTPTTAPKTPSTIPPAAPTPPPGQWTHPRLDEITRRQAASTFSTRNLQSILYAVLFIASTFVTPRFWPTWATPTLPSDVRLYASLVLPTLRILGLCQILISLLPLIRKPDDINDIPLTPRQRSLLNLAPSSHPATPESKFITPPRYSRSTPRTGSAGDRRIGSAGSSRAATVGSPLQRSVSGSPLGGPSPLTTSGAGASMLGASGSPFALTPSPGSGSPLARKAIERRSSVGLTNKWLYQKRRESAGGYFS